MQAMALHGRKGAGQRALDRDGAFYAGHGVETGGLLLAGRTRASHPNNYG